MGKEQLNAFELENAHTDAKIRAINADAFSDITRWLSATGAILCFAAGFILPFTPLLFLVPSLVVTTNSWLAYRKHGQLKANYLNQTLPTMLHKKQRRRLFQTLLLAAAILICGLAVTGFAAPAVLAGIMAAVVISEALYFVADRFDQIRKKRLLAHENADEAHRLKKDIRFTIFNIVAGLTIGCCALAILFNPVVAPAVTLLAITATTLPLLGRVYAGRDFLLGSSTASVWLHRIAALSAVTGLLIAFAVPGLNVAALALVGASVALSYGGALKQYFASVRQQGSFMFTGSHPPSSTVSSESVRGSTSRPPTSGLFVNEEAFKPLIHGADKEQKQEEKKDQDEKVKPDESQKPNEVQVENDIKKIVIFSDIYSKLPPRKPATELRFASGNVKKFKK